MFYKGATLFKRLFYLMNNIFELFAKITRSCLKLLHWICIYQTFHLCLANTRWPKVYNIHIWQLDVTFDLDFRFQIAFCLSFGTTHHVRIGLLDSSFWENGIVSKGIISKPIRSLKLTWMRLFWPIIRFQILLPSLLIPLDTIPGLASLPCGAINKFIWLKTQKRPPIGYGPFNWSLEGPVNVVWTTFLKRKHLREGIFLSNFEKWSNWTKTDISQKKDH